MAVVESHPVVFSQSVSNQTLMRIGAVVARRSSTITSSRMADGVRQHRNTSTTKACWERRCAMVSLEQKDGDIPNLRNQGLPSDPTEGKLVSLHLTLSQGPNQLEPRESHI